MKNFILIFCLFFVSFSPLFCQNSDIEVKKVIEDFFFALQQKDTTQLNKLLWDGQAEIITTQRIRGFPKIFKIQIKDFLTAIGSVPENEEIEEWVYDWNIEVDRDFASVGCKFTFYENNKFSHCGRNQFNLAKLNKNGWVITSIMDSRNTMANSMACMDRQINTMLVNWHKAATDADEEAFFGSMTRDCIYLGTDASERWLRDELRSWSGKAFDEAPAWDFKTISRRIYIHNDGESAWFEENLDTWMGECRGSGIVVLQEDGSWKIRHYNLALTVKNEKIKKVMEANK